MDQQLIYVPTDIVYGTGVIIFSSYMAGLAPYMMQTTAYMCGWAHICVGDTIYGPHCHIYVHPAFVYDRNNLIYVSADIVYDTGVTIYSSYMAALAPYMMQTTAYMCGWEHTCVWDTIYGSNCVTYMCLWISYMIIQTTYMCLEIPYMSEDNKHMQRSLIYVAYMIVKTAYMTNFSPYMIHIRVI